MRQLSRQDAACLYTDTVHSNHNVSLLHIFDQATAPGGVVRFKAILAQIQRRLHRSPLFRQRLQGVPLGLDRPYWVDDANFDLEYHVRHIALPKPGDWRQFCIQASRLHARPLDLDRPLWEVYVIEGLDSFLDLPAGSFALLLKTHQAAVDLGLLAELSADLLDDSAASRMPPAPPEPWFAQATPGPLRLARRGAWRALRSPLRLATPLLQQAWRAAPATLSRAGGLLLQPPGLPVTRFSSVVSPHRVFETRRFAESDIKAIAGLVPGATVDDVVLTLCGDALRRYLLVQHELPPTLDLQAQVHWPQAGAAAQRRQVTLATTLPDPVQGLSAVKRQRLADARTPAASSSLLSKARQWLAPACSKPGQPAGLPLTLANARITMLPAQAEPLYLCGARLCYVSAILPIQDGLGLAFAVNRYDGLLVISPTSCRELLPDPDLLAQCLRDSFQDLLALAQGKAVAVVTPTKPQAAPARSRRVVKLRAKPGAKPSTTAEPGAARRLTAAGAGASASGSSRRKRPAA